MKHVLADKNIDYDGSQLRSGWISEEFGIGEDAIAAFIGACDVKPEFMVDLEDLGAGAKIYSREMLHFIVQHKGSSLKEITLRQRLLICIIRDALEESVPGLKIVRSGDDLFDRDAKLTISIATTSPVSGLIHAGINISSEGTPVKTKGLKDLAINPKVLALSISERYSEETDSVSRCLTKVKEVG